MAKRWNDPVANDIIKVINQTAFEEAILNNQAEDFQKKLGDVLYKLELRSNGQNYFYGLTNEGENDILREIRTSFLVLQQYNLLPVKRLAAEKDKIYISKYVARVYDVKDNQPVQIKVGGYNQINNVAKICDYGNDDIGQILCIGLNQKDFENLFGRENKDKSIINTAYKIETIGSPKYIQPKTPNIILPQNVKR